jgi:hypothetical protein
MNPITTYAQALQWLMGCAKTMQDAAEQDCPIGTNSLMDIIGDLEHVKAFLDQELAKRGEE